MPRKLAKNKTMNNTKSKKEEIEIPIRISIGDAPDGKVFWVWNGPPVRNLRELRGALGIMSDDQFNHHTKRDGNDFARWIENVLGAKICAGKIDRAKTREATIKVLENYI